MVENVMNDKKNFSMNMNLLQHFDAAVEDEEARLKDSDRYQELSQIDKKYTEIKPLNEGGMKQIILCHDRYTDRDVAMAVPKDELDAEGIDRFIEEARITGSLEHPNIVPVHELSIDEGRPFFTMKILDGENLGEILKKIKSEKYAKVYTQVHLLEIFLKVCDAIAYAHANGILHLDIKPSNIQINEYGEVLVCDWGLSQYLDRKTSVKSSVMGTPGFMAPELIRGEQLTEKADIFSLGSLLYCMLERRNPFGDGDEKSTKQNVLVGEFNHPLNLPISLKAIIEKALSKDPDDRYKECSLMADDVRAYLAGFATSAEGAGFFTLFLLLVKRYKVLSVTVAFFIILLTSLTSVFIADLNREKAIAIIAKEDAEKSRDIATLAQEDSLSVRKNAAPQFLKYARREFFFRNYDKTYALADEALKLDPGFEHARNFMVNLLIGRHEFNKALKLVKTFKNQKPFKGRVELINFCLDLQKKGSLIMQDELLPKIASMRYIKGAPGVRHYFLYTATMNYPFEERLDFARRYLDSITKSKFTFDLKKEGESFSLSLAHNNGMYSISVLNNLPIVELNLTHTPITDLLPLRNMKLRKLNLLGTDVLDLSPLADTPLVELNIYNTNVKSIGKLKDTPLEEITLNKRWIDVKSLMEFKHLKKINIPRGVLGRASIRELKTKYKVVEF